MIERIIPLRGNKLKRRKKLNVSGMADSSNLTETVTIEKRHPAMTENRLIYTSYTSLIVTQLPPSSHTHNTPSPHILSHIHHLKLNIPNLPYLPPDIIFHPPSHTSPPRCHQRSGIHNMTSLIRNTECRCLGITQYHSSR